MVPVLSKLSWVDPLLSKGLDLLLGNITTKGWVKCPNYFQCLCIEDIMLKAFSQFETLIADLSEVLN